MLQYGHIDIGFGCTAIVTGTSGSSGAGSTSSPDQHPGLGRIREPHGRAAAAAVRGRCTARGCAGHFHNAQAAQGSVALIACTAACAPDRDAAMAYDSTIDTIASVVVVTTVVFPDAAGDVRPEALIVDRATVAT